MYARFPAELDRTGWGGVPSEGADLAVIRRRNDPSTQRICDPAGTVRAIGTFQPDPAAVPEPVVAAVARQVGIDDLEVLTGCLGHAGAVGHTAEIRTATGTATSLGRTGSPSPSGCTGRPGPMRWPRRCCSAQPAGFLPGRSCCPGKPCWLGWSPRCANAPPIGFTAAWREQSPELRSQLDKLLVVPEGQRRSELTCCAGRRSRPPSRGWCARWTG